MPSAAAAPSATSASPNSQGSASAPMAGRIASMRLLRNGSRPGLAPLPQRIASAGANASRCSLARRMLGGGEGSDVAHRDRAGLGGVDLVVVLVDERHARLRFVLGELAVAVGVGRGEALLQLGRHLAAPAGVGLL